jgi:hypothetical protein
MLLADALGFVAAALTLAAFAQKSLMPMRLAALGANLFFIGYGALGDHYPVLALHLILLPVNLSRLAEQWMRKSKPRDAAGVTAGLVL